MIALTIESYLTQIDTLELPEDAASYLYGQRSIIKLFLYALIEGITHFKTLHQQLLEKPAVLSLVGLSNIPHRVTLSRRFKTLPESLRQLLMQLHDSFVEQSLSQALVMSADSMLMHASGNVWHAQDRKAGRYPSCGNIDTDAHWGVSGANEWVFGYRLHCLVSGDAGAPLPRDVRVHPANVRDASVFREELCGSFNDETLVVLADSGYDEAACYASCDDKEISLIAPITVKKGTPSERRERAALYQDPEVREVFAVRRITVEPFQGHLKELFALEYLPVKGLLNVRALVTLAVVAYVLLALLNHRLGRDVLRLQSTLFAIR